MSLRIYGASDDLVEIEGDITEEIGCYDSAVTLEVGQKDGGIRVIGEYAPGAAAVWRFSLEPVDEDIPVPWPVRVELGGRGYSCVVIIDCPPGTPVYQAAKVGESRRLT